MTLQGFPSSHSAVSPISAVIIILGWYNIPIPKQ
jgi:hypothetical protein